MQKTLSEILYCIADEIEELETQTEEAKDLANIGYMIESAKVGCEMNCGAQFNAIWDRTRKACENVKQIRAYVDEIKSLLGD